MSRRDFLDRRAALKRGRILDAARLRFSADGFERASVEDISKDAEVSTATLYKMYPSKLALFEATIRQGVAVFEDKFAAKPSRNARDHVTRVTTAYAELLQDPVHAGGLRAVISAATSSPEVAAVFYDAAKRVVSGAFREAMASAIAEGLLDTSDAAEPAAHAMGMIEHATLWGQLLANEPSSLSAERIAASAVEVILRAYAPRG